MKPNALENDLDCLTIRWARKQTLERRLEFGDQDQIYALNILALLDEAKDLGIELVPPDSIRLPWSGATVPMDDIDRGTLRELIEHLLRFAGKRPLQRRWWRRKRE